jgi:hypothetical protein
MDLLQEKQGWEAKSSHDRKRLLAAFTDERELLTSKIDSLDRRLSSLQ